MDVCWEVERLFLEVDRAYLLIGDIGGVEISSSDIGDPL
jgi:hypothetical protein